MSVWGPGWTIVASSAGGIRVALTRPIGWGTGSHGRKIVARPRSSVNSSVSKTPPAGPAGLMSWADSVAANSPMAPRYQASASALSTMSVMTAAGLGAGGGWLLGGLGLGGCSRPPPAVAPFLGPARADPRPPR